MSEPRGMMACVGGWQNIHAVPVKRVTIQLSIDKNCSSCAFSDVLDDDIFLTCTELNIAVADHGRCGKWKLTKDCDDFHYLNPQIIGVVNEQAS